MTRGGVVTGLGFEARLFERVWTGSPVYTAAAPGARAAAAAQRLLQDGATWLLSFGVAGGLRPGLEPGVLVVSTVIQDVSRSFVCHADPVAAALGAAPGTLITVGTPVTEPAAKAELAAAGAVAVDMESAHVAAAAHAAGVPMLAIRAVADPADRRLPRLATRAVDAQGQLVAAAVVRSLVTDPGDWPAVAQAAGDAARARASLRRAATGLARLAREGLLHRLLHVPIEDVDGRALL